MVLAKDVSQVTQDKLFVKCCLGLKFAVKSWPITDYAIYMDSTIIVVSFLSLWTNPIVAKTQQLLPQQSKFCYFLIFLLEVQIHNRFQKVSQLFAPQPQEPSDKQPRFRKRNHIWQN